MEKWLLSTFILFFLFASNAQALSWAYPFIVWKGNVYEVKLEEKIEQSEIGKVIGKVKTVPDDMTGNYYGDASNYFSVGSKYYSIEGIETSKEIAIKNDGDYVRAVYAHSAPFHIMNIVTSPFFMILLILIIVLPLIILYRKKKIKRKKSFKRTMNS